MPRLSGRDLERPWIRCMHILLPRKLRDRGGQRHLHSLRSGHIQHSHDRHPLVVMQPVLLQHVQPGRRNSLHGLPQPAVHDPAGEDRPVRLLVVQPRVLPPRQRHRLLAMRTRALPPPFKF